MIIVRRQIRGVDAIAKRNHSVVRRRSATRPRPANPIRDAASLILLRRTNAGPQVLLGRRTAASRFMPGMYVFPGGALQREDFDARTAGALHESYARMMGVRGNPDLAGALAKTAIRETLEETGLMLGQPGDVGDLNDHGWRAAKAAGLQPCLRSMTYLGRAVTPPGMPIRFNARFFIAPESEVRGKPADTDELDDLRWVTPQQGASGALPMVSITAYILNRFEQILHRAEQGQSFVYRHYTHNDRTLVDWR